MSILASLAKAYDRIPDAPPYGYSSEKIGFVISLACALFAHRNGWFERPFGTFSAILYTIPSLALFQLLVPVSGLGSWARKNRPAIQNARRRYDSSEASG